MKPRNWILSFLEGEEWKDCGTYPSGASAKTNARFHQAGKGTRFLYKITDPSGNPWRFGVCKITRRGYKMEWFFLPENTSRTVYQCIARGCPGCSVCNPE